MESMKRRQLMKSSQRCCCCRRRNVNGDRGAGVGTRACAMTALWRYKSVLFLGALPPPRLGETPHRAETARVVLWERRSRPEALAPVCPVFVGVREACPAVATGEHSAAGHHGSLADCEVHPEFCCRGELLVAIMALVLVACRWRPVVPEKMPFVDDVALARTPLRATKIAELPAAEACDVVASSLLFYHMPAVKASHPLHFPTELRNLISVL